LYGTQAGAPATIVRTDPFVPFANPTHRPVAVQTMMSPVVPKTRPRVLAVDATTPAPMATEFVAVACAPCPNAIALAPLASALVPTATVLTPAAFAFAPKHCQL
jgi:hypothetical protein